MLFVVMGAAIAETLAALIMWMFASSLRFHFRMLRIEQEHTSEVRQTLTGWSDSLHACNGALREWERANKAINELEERRS